MQHSLPDPWEDSDFLAAHEHIGRFFRVSFCADWLPNQSSLEAAVDDYSGDNIGSRLEDRSGVQLLAEVTDVLERGYSEKQLTYLIEHHWETQGDSGPPWGSYHAVLTELRQLLSSHK